jgi:hypothetical protein
MLKACQETLSRVTQANIQVRTLLDGEAIVTRWEEEDMFWRLKLIEADDPGVTSRNSTRLG